MGCTWLLENMTEHKIHSSYEPHHAKMGLRTCADSVAPDQPAHPCSLIWELHCPLLCTVDVNWPTSGQCSSQIRLRGCAGWSEATLSAHCIITIFAWCGSYSIWVLLFELSAITDLSIFVEPGPDLELHCVRIWHSTGRQNGHNTNGVQSIHQNNLWAVAWDRNLYLLR